MLVTESEAMKGWRRVTDFKLVLKVRREFLREIKSNFVSD